MVPFHPLREETRVVVARLLAAVALFATVAAVLLAGSSEGPLASAEANPSAAGPPDIPNGNAYGLGGSGPPAHGLDGGAQQNAVGPGARAAPPAAAPAPPGHSGSGRGNGAGNRSGGRGNGAGGTSPARLASGGATKGKQAGKQAAASSAPASSQVEAAAPSAPAATDRGAETKAEARRKARRELRIARAARARAERARAERARAERAGAGQPAGGAVGEEPATAVPAPAAGGGGFERVGRAEDGSDGSAKSRERRGDRKPAAEQAAEGPSGPPLFRNFTDRIPVVPDSFKAALVALGALSLLLGLGYLFAAIRNRSLARQRRELLTEVGLLQSALLPPVPERIGALRTSVAYRPADGPGAGGDFYDVLPLAGGSVGFILGDVSGHGRGALARTAFMRYTLRAYLEAGLEPRVALQVAGRVIDDNLGGDFATVLLAVHDPATGTLTYASAGHPSPLVVGPQPHDPVTVASSPPIGVGVGTGLRQTTVPLVPGSVACMFTDGLMEARVDGGILGRDRLEELLEELGGDATARGLVDSVRSEARVLSDDIAAVVIQPAEGSTSGQFRTEQLELSVRELEGPTARRFLEACGVSDTEVEAAVHDARTVADRFGGVVLHVVFGNRQRVEVLPRNVESIEAASRRAAAR